jgi:mono/diheme cytochrome c family protein
MVKVVVRVGLASAIVGAVATVAACRVSSSKAGDTSSVSSSANSSPNATRSQSDSSHYLVAGDSLQFVQHDENLPPGFPLAVKPVSVRNPYEGDKKATAMGAQLFVSYNCLDCHGAEGSGAMAPSFQDGRWHFGGSPAEVFESIYQGRPDGMPAWGGRISNDEIWMLTAYVRSLSAKDLSTENFTGKTVERTGH